MESLIGKKELAERLDVSQTTINRMLVEGLPNIKVRGQVKFIYQEVIQWLKERGK